MIKRFLSLLVLLLAGCGKEPSPLDYVVRQSVAVGGEERVEVLEDGRLSPEMSEAMWGRSKEPADFLAAPGVTASEELKRAFAREPVRHALVRLVDRDGRVLYERRLDCELAALAEHALGAGEDQVWAVGNDCATGEGDYAGLITRFFTVAGDKVHWQDYVDAATGERQELTLVQARRITWHLTPPDRLETVLEVSSHPDFSDPRFQDLPPGAPLPAAVPPVIDYIRYRYEGAGNWTRLTRTDKPATWQASDGFPEAAKFPD
jgi:hypothetical protein